MKLCRLCGGDLALLGALGNLKHYRCIHCGMQFNKMIRRRWDAPRKEAK